MPVAIKAENISKAYQLGQLGTGTISRDLERWFAKVRGKEDPFLRIGEDNDRTTVGTSNIVWSLRDIDFEVQQGQVVGVIGRNGAGKSTLLKILSRVTAPTRGSIKVKGRIASLLEVGTGFHPELTGRENIYLNGAILGMRKKEIQRKLDEIVAFSGVERYLDTPVKRYSSGMYVRLAFAVAAHLESEILIVDEVLAVGDMEFQKKCLGKMKDVSNDGRTVLFVSHQMGSIAQLCSRALLLYQGRIIKEGPVEETIDAYLAASGTSSRYVYDPAKKKKSEIYFEEVMCIDEEGREVGSYKFDDSILVNMKIRVNLTAIDNIKVGMALLDKNETRVFSSLEDLKKFPISHNTAYITVKLPHSLFAPGAYKFLFAVHIPNQQMFDLIENVCDIKIYDNGTEFAELEGYHYGSIIIKPEWHTHKNA
jgi:lipopolysaccharide transport system ATP-binding protein